MTQKNFKLHLKSLSFTSFTAKVPSWMKTSLTDRIVGGKAANGPIPWQVSVQRRQAGFVSQHFCGGTILDANTGAKF